MQVVVSDHPFADLEIERAALAGIGAELVVAPSSDEETLVAAAATADAMLVCYAEIPASVIEAAAAHGCKIISRTGIGVNNIDVPAATRAGIQVTNVPDYCLDEVADQAMCLLLLCARQLLAGVETVRAGAWHVPHGEVHRVAGRRLALIGVGGIGRRVLERALPFGLEVVGYDPFLKDDLPGLVRIETVEEAVEQADFVSLHAPLTPETRHLIGERLIAVMQRAPFVINTSRGGLVDTQAALAALDSGALSGLALDVTEEEPPSADSPLRNHPRVILTPHMGFYSVEAERELQQRAVDEVLRAFRSEPPACPVN